MPEFRKETPNGYVSGYLPDEPGEQAEIQSLVVYEHATRNGLGSNLLNAFIIEAVMAGASEIIGTLGCNYTSYTDAERLRRLYEKHGFEIIEREGINPLIVRKLD